ESLADMMDIDVKKTAMAKILSRAAMGINVLVMGPSALNSLAMDKAGIGAVAIAMAPKITAI
ncbi:hypothetical protein, partial [Salmonella enterica]|uniref:hypothetical protein n=1 Tax=Salmonella enterica TaxID=28901 RepID=UPI0032979E05